MSPFETKGISPFAAGPNGAGTRRLAGADVRRARHDDQREHEEGHARSSATACAARTQSGLVISATGSHLSGNVQRGPLPLASGRAPGRRRCSRGSGPSRRSPRIDGRLRSRRSGVVMRPALPSTGDGLRRRRSDRDPHLAQGAMEPRLHGADGDAQGRRDIRQRQPQEVVQDDDRTAGVVQPLHRGIDELAVGDRAGHVGDRRHVDRRELDLDRRGVVDDAPGRGTS